VALLKDWAAIGAGLAVEAEKKFDRLFWGGSLKFDSYFYYTFSSSSPLVSSFYT